MSRCVRWVGDCRVLWRMCLALCGEYSMFRIFNSFLIILGFLLSLCGCSNTSSSLSEPTDSNPVSGFEIKCSPSWDSFEVGKPIRIKCMITNKTNIAKPFLWDHRGELNFSFNHGDAYPPGAGRYMKSIPEIEDPLMVKSRPMNDILDIRKDLIFYVPAGDTLVFHLTLYPSNYHKAGVYSARVTYDPVPLYASDARPSDPNRYREKYLTSDIITLKIVDNNR